MKPFKELLEIAFFILIMMIALPLQSQIINPETTAKEKGTDKLNNKIEEGIDEGYNKMEKTLGKLLKKKDKSKNSEEKVEKADKSDNTNASGTAVMEETAQQQKLESYTQYDFVPGDKIILFEDFSQDAVGDFPALWTSNGSGEVKTINIADGKWLHMNVDEAVYCFAREIAFPENFIMEFDLIPNAEYEEFELTLYEDPENDELDTDLYPGEKGIHFHLNSDYGGGWMTKGYYEDKWLEGSSQKNMIEKEKINHVIIWVQKRRVRIYHQGAKVLDMPTNLPSGIKLNRLRFANLNEECKPFVSNIKITTASPDTRSKLLSEGKLISYGIYFDSGKDVVKPESYGSIKEIATVLQENPGVQIKIIGHTDSDGNDALNLDLSKRRALSVKNYLVKEFSIDAGRVETDGLGEGQPLESNNTSVGKAKNRRVEFIKL